MKSPITPEELDCDNTDAIRKAFDLCIECNYNRVTRMAVVLKGHVYNRLRGDEPAIDDFSAMWSLGKLEEFLQCYKDAGWDIKISNYECDARGEEMSVDKVIFRSLK